MFTKTYKNKLINLPIIIGIFIFSILLMNVITMNNPNVFVADDNALQWEPIIKTSFDELFKTGHLPYINFYQYKKMNLLDVGYYSLLNPFMLLSYIINKFLLLDSYKIIGVYIYLLFALGNCTMYVLLRKLNIKVLNSLLSVLAYSSVSYFIDWGFYYFSFNNYFFIPLLLLIIVSFQGSKLQYIAPGITLAFSLLLGHVQYTCFYYIIFGIIYFYLALKNNSRYFILLLSNAILGLFLSAPQLLILLQASGNRSNVIGDSNDFMAMAISLPTLLTHFAIPKFLSLKALHIANEPISTNWWENSWSNNRSTLDTFNLNYIYLGFILPLFLLFFYKDIRKAFSYFKKNITIKNLEVCFTNIKKKEFYFQVLNKIKNIASNVSIIIAQEVQYISASAKKKKLLHFSIFIVIGLFYFICLSNLSAKYFIYLIALSLLIAPFVLWILHKIKSNSEIHYNATLLNDYKWAFAFTTMFFLLFCYGKKGVIALILSKLPVINTFRFLYKGFFVCIPLMVILAADTLERLNKRKILMKGFTFCFSLLGILNSWFMVNSGLNTYYNNPIFEYNHDTDYATTLKNRFQELNIDTKNYRFISVVDDHIYNNYIDTASAKCYTLLTKNMATELKVFALAGYDNAFSYESYRQSNLIYSDIALNNMYLNAINGNEYFINILQNISKYKNYTTYNYFTEKLMQQFNNNSIKYILIDKQNTDTIHLLEEIFSHLSPIQIIREVSVSDNALLIELSNIESLCKNSKKEFVPLHSSISNLSFEINNKSYDEVMQLSFIYDSHYKAQLKTGNGQLIPLKITPTEDFYTSITTPRNLTGTVIISYENRLFDLSVLLSIFISLLFLLVILILIFVSRKEKI